MPSGATSESQASIPTNLRVLAVLEEVALAGVPITPTEANTRLHLPKPTLHRLFATMEREGFLQRDLDGRSYSPGPRLRALSINVQSSMRIRTARLAVLTTLAETVGETCNIATPDRHNMTYLERVETKWPLRIQLPIGTAVPFHCTASGKMYLSTLRASHLRQYLTAARLEAHTPATMTDPETLIAAVAQVRRQGHATDDEEFLEGMVAVAVPILDQRKRLLSTLSVHAPRQRVSLDDLKAHLPLMRDTAQNLARLLTED